MHGRIPPTQPTPPAPPNPPASTPELLKQRLERCYAPLAVIGQGTTRRRIYPEHILPTTRANFRRGRVDRLFGPAAVAFFAGFVCCLGCILLGLFFSR